MTWKPLEFAINSARSSTTGFSPFQLNYGRNPSSLIWKVEDEFPGVQLFAERMKMAVMSAHDAIIVAHINNTVQANKKRATATYKEGDLVYLSMKNISLPKGLACKLAPKFLGPFKISKILKEGATYQLDLSEELLKQGINRAFHVSLLKPHVPSDDRRFPGRLPAQIPGFGKRPDEWVIKAIIDHQGRGIDSKFEIQWKAGDRTWALYREVMHLMVLEQYCELMGVSGPGGLLAKRSKGINETEGMVVSAVRVKGGLGYKNPSGRGEGVDISLMPHCLSHESFLACATYTQRVSDWRHSRGPPPDGPPPSGYNDYIIMLNDCDRTMER